MTKLTTNEQRVLRACYASEYASGEKNPSPWSWSVTEHSGLAKRSVAGVIASLVKKGILSSQGEGTKDYDNYVTVTDAGFEVAKSLGLIEEFQGNFGTGWQVVELPTDETSEPKPAAKKTAPSQTPSAKNARRIIRNYLRTAIEFTMDENVTDVALIEAMAAAEDALSTVPGYEA